MNQILIVEDEKPILNLIRMNLMDAGYACTCAETGTEAADILEKENFDLAILDIMLPGLNGYELLEYIRPMQIPVIFLTAKSEVSDRVRGLKLGAEDYIVKPFEIVELLARVETVLRRYHKTSRILSVYDIEADTMSRIVRKGGIPVSLTAKEYEILLLFLRNKNIALFRDRIYESVWGKCIWATAGRWTCTSRGCERNSGLNPESFRYIKSVIVWRWMGEIFWKLFFSIVLITELFLGIGGCILIQSVFRHSVRREIEAAWQENDFICISLNQGALLTPGAPMAFGTDVESPEALLENLYRSMTLQAEGSGIPFSLSDRQGMLIAGSRPEGLENHLAAQLDMEHRGYEIRKVENTYYLHCVQPLQIRGMYFLVENYRDMTSVFQNQSRYIQTFSLLMVLVLVVGGSVIFLLSYWIVRPIRQLSQASKNWRPVWIWNRCMCGAMMKLECWRRTLTVCPGSFLKTWQN